MPAPTDNEAHRAWMSRVGDEYEGYITKKRERRRSKGRRSDAD